MITTHILVYLKFNLSSIVLIPSVWDAIWCHFYILHVFHLSTSRTLREAPQYRTSVEESCKHLLNHHLSTIHYMLSLKSTAKHRQMVLKLLTGQCCSRCGIHFYLRVI